MKQIPLTQGQFTLVDDEDFDWLIVWNRFAVWEPRMCGFRAVRNHNHRPLYIHRAITNAPKGFTVDHRNLNTLDNRKSNLRVCLHRQNLCNRERSINNTSGYKGVFYNREKRKWEATITVNYHCYHLGRFSDPVEAALQYDKAALKFQGEFARLNFPNLQSI